MKNLLWALFVLAARATMDLVLLEDAAKNEGAVCLDGSAAGYFIRRAANSTGWSIHIEGGGWCYKESDCVGRTSGGNGSSKTWKTTHTTGGSYSEDASVNPDMYNWNLVYIPYCDGASFTGDREDPVDVDGTKLYFRGYRVLKAVFKALLENEGMKNAEKVFLSGTSAGGLSVYEHVDQIASWLPASATFKASPYSGLFLNVPTVEGKSVYQDELKYVFTMQNSTAGAHEGCLAAKPEGEKWKCMFAQEILPYIKTPIMLANSAYDSWSTGCIWTSEPVAADSSKNGNCTAVAEWKTCMGGTCTADQIETLNTKWADEFMKVIKNSETLTRDGNGYYIYSCHMHVAEVSHFNKIKVNDITFQQALSKWYFSNNEPAANHQYVDCMYTSNFCCNPTCCE